MTLIYCVPKSPHQRGRKPPVETQDWSVAVDFAISLAKKIDNPIFLVLSGFHAKGELSEAQIYREAILSRSGNAHLINIESGTETIGHVEGAMLVAKNINEEIIFVTTRLHYWRVRWLVKAHTVLCPERWGRARPREAITDLVLAILFPLLDLCGLRNVFLKLVRHRRARGDL